MKFLFSILLLLVSHASFSQFTSIKSALNGGVRHSLSLDLSNDTSRILSDDIYKIKNLTSLIICGKYCKRIPRQLTTLWGIKSLTLIDFDLNEDDLVILNKIGNLDVLVLNDIQSKKPINWEESRFKSLKCLNLYQCSSSIITDGIYSLSELTELRIINSNYTFVSDDIGKLEKLETLQLSGNKLNKLPSSISLLKKLNYVNLSNNLFTQCPLSVVQLTSLKYLYLNQNKLKKMEEIFMNEKEFYVIYLDSNNFTAFPNSIKKMTELSTLSLSYNSLNKMPDWITNFKKLSTLNLSNNNLTSIDNVLCNLENIAFLNVSNNKLTNLDNCLLKYGFYGFEFENNLFSKIELKRIKTNLVHIVLAVEDESDYPKPPEDESFQEVNFSNKINITIKELPTKFDENYFLRQRINSQYSIFSNKNGDWFDGLMDSNQQIILPAIFHYIGEYPSDEKNRYLIFYINKQGPYNFDKNYGVFDLIEKKWKFPLQYDLIAKMHTTNDLCLIQKDGKWGVFNKNFIEILPLIYQEAPQLLRSNTSYVCRLNNKFGVKETINNTMPIPFIYDGIYSITGTSRFIVKKEKQYNLVDSVNNVLFPSWYETISTTNSRNIYKVKDKEKWYYVDQNGVRVDPYEMREFDYKSFQFDVNGKLGQFVNDSIILPFEYEVNLTNFNSEFIVAKRNNKFGFLCFKSTGRIIECESFTFDSLFKLPNVNFYLFKESGKYGLLDTKRNRVNPNLYDSIKVFSASWDDPIFKVFNSKECNLMDQNGRLIFKTFYEEFSIINLAKKNINPRIMIKAKEKKGTFYLVDDLGKVYTRNSFNDILFANNVYFIAKRGKKFQVIDLENLNILFDGDYDTVFQSKECIYAIKGLHILKLNFRWEIEKGQKLLKAEAIDQNKLFPSTIKDQSNFQLSSYQLNPPFNDSYNLFSIKNKEKSYGICRKNGDIILPPIFDRYYSRSDKINLSELFLSIDNKKGVFDLRSLKWKINLGYDDLRLAEGNSNFYITWKESNDFYGLIDSIGIEILPFLYKSIRSLKFNPNIVIVAKSNKAAFYDVSRKVFLTSFIYDQAYEIDNRKMVKVEINSQKNLLDSNLNSCFKNNYDEIICRDGKVNLLVKKDGFLGSDR
jgi:Leucine-rich repeat (LRR) protein